MVGWIDSRAENIILFLLSLRDTQIFPQPLLRSVVVVLAADDKRKLSDVFDSVGTVDRLLGTRQSSFFKDLGTPIREQVWRGSGVDCQVELTLWRVLP